jgi:protein phosphatase/serine/threonine-protein phosphatase Stp1
MIAAPIETDIVAAGRFRSSAASHPSAVRRRNEDSWVNRPDLGLWAVADGAGGHEAGDLASAIIADTLDEVPAGLDAARLPAEVRLRLDDAHRRLQREALRRGPDASLVSTVVVLLAREAQFTCLWAGDSRAYLLRDGALRRLTHDHSLVQELLDAGAISLAEARRHPQRNVITRAIGGVDEAAAVDAATGRLRSGDRFLLCSDGLFKAVFEPELRRLMAEGGERLAERLVAAALARHADDNVTAVALEFVVPPPTVKEQPGGSG